MIERKKFFYYCSLIALWFLASSSHLRADTNLTVGASNTESTNYSGNNINWDTIFIGPTNYSDNSLTLSSATYGANGISVGDSPLSSNNSLFVANATLRVTNPYSLTIGSSSSYNSMTVSNSTCYNSNQLYVGEYGNNNTLMINAASKWYNYSSASPIVGYFGSSNSVTISNATMDFSSDLFVGYNGNNNSFILQSNGGISGLGTVDVGFNGSSNSFIISNSLSTTLSGALQVGIGTSSFNTVLVSGSWLNISSTVYIGDGTGSNNSLNVASNSLLNITGSLIIGNSNNNNNSVLIEGGSELFMSNSSGCIVGYGANNNSLIISNGSSFIINSGITIGSTGSSNSMLIADVGSGTVSLGSISVGSGAGCSANSLTISNAPSVNITSLNVGNGGSSNNSVVFAGNSTLTLSSPLELGNSGSSNTLTIADGATVNLESNNGGSSIGNNSGANNNTLMVTGSNSTLNSYWELIVGFNSNTSGNSLIISNSGTVNAYAIGLSMYSYSNTVIVTGSNSILNATDLNITLGSNNSVTIENGGTANIEEVLIGGAYSVNNHLTITDTNSSLTCNVLAVGGVVSPNNNCTITNGGSLFCSNDIFIGTYVGSDHNTLTVTGTNSLLVCYGGTNLPETNLPVGGIWIGAGGSNNVGASYNELLISDGGTVISSEAVAGFTNGAAHNAIVVEGTGSSLLINSTNTYSNVYSFVIGYLGSSNSLTISNGGYLSNSFGVIGFYSSDNSAIVTGSNSIWSNNNNFYLGFAGGTNSLTISGGALLSVTGIGGSNVLSGASYIGLSSSGNTAFVTDTNSAWNSAGSLFVGNIGSNNTLTISNGGSVTDNQTVTETIIVDHGVTNITYTTNFAAYIGWASSSASNNVTISGSGSSWDNNGDVVVGYAGYGNSLIINGGTVTGSNVYVGYTSTASNNSITMNGGIWSNTGTLNVGLAGSGNNVTLDGGTSTFANVSVGNAPGTSNNNLFVTGTGATLNITDDLTVGNGGVSNNVTITNGGAIYSSNTYVQGGSNNTILVTGADSLLSNTGILMIGSSTNAGNLIISDGASVIADQGIDITNGTLFSYGTNLISNVITLEGSGTNFAELFISGALTMGTLNVGSNGMIAMQMGAGYFTADTITNASGTNTSLIFNHSGTSLNNGTNIVGIYTNGDLTASDCSSYGMSGPQFSISNNGSNNTIHETILTNATFTSSVAIYQTNAVDLGNLTLAGYYVTSTVSTNGIISLPTNSGTLLLISNTALINNGLLSGYELIISEYCTLKGTGTNTFYATNAYTNSDGTTLTYSVDNEGTIAPGNSPGTLHFRGGLYNSSTATIEIGLAGTNLDQYCHLTVDDGSLIVDSSLLRIGFLDDEKGQGHIFVPAYGDLFDDILSASTGIYGNFFTVAAPSGYRMRLLYVTDVGGQRTEFITPPPFYTSIDGLIAPESYTEAAQNQNQINVATALNTFITSPVFDEQVVSTALDHLTAAQYPAAFNQIAPTLYQSLSTIAFNLYNANNMELIQRLWGARVADGGFSMNGFGENMPIIQDPNEHHDKNDILRPGAQTPWGIFIDSSGIFAQANSGNLLPTYNSESGGITTGLTYKWNDHVVSGLYTGYQGVYTKYNTTPTGTLIQNSVRFGLFGTYGEKEGKGFFVDALLGGDYSGYTMQRYINFNTINRTATGNPGAGELDAMLATGYDLKKGNWTYGPLMSLQYAYFGVSPFNETGANSLNLSNVSWETSSMIYSIGSHVAYRWQVNKDLVVVPQINLSWQHEFLQNPYTIGATLGGVNFNNSSSTPLRDTLYTGIGFSLEFAKKWDASFFYNAAAGNSDLISQNIFLSLGMRF